VDLGPYLRNKLDYVTGTHGLLHDRNVIRVARGPLRGAEARRSNLIHVEAGIKLIDLNRLLDTLQLALPTMGGSQGQQLAGAFSTSTHGSDFAHGPVADHVLAVHLVTTGGQEVWIESTSRPVTRNDEVLRAVLPCPDTQIIRDDEALNAVTVGLGRFGIIYSVVIETMPEHELREWTSKRNVDEMLGLLRAGAGQVNPLAPLIDAAIAGPSPGWARTPPGADSLKYIDITFSSRPAADGWVRRRWVRRGTRANPVVPADPNWPDPTAWAKIPIVAPAIIAGTMATLAASAGVVAGLLPGLMPPLAPVSGPIALTWAASVAARTAELSARPVGRDGYYAGDALADAINTIIGAATGLPWPFESYSDFVYDKMEIDGLLNTATQSLLSDAFPETTASTPDGKRGRSWNVSAGSSGGSGAPHYRVDSMEFVFTMADSRFVDFLDFVRARSETFVQTGYVAIRFTKSAQALLSMHNFGGGLAISIEITSLRGLRDNAAWFQLLQTQAFRLGGRLHWGQLNNLQVHHPVAGYRTNLIRWKEQLVRIAGNSRTFSNAYTRQRNLEPDGIVRIVTHVARTDGRITHVGNPASYWQPVPIGMAVAHITNGHLTYAIKHRGRNLMLSVRRLIRSAGNILETLPNGLLDIDIVGRIAGDRHMPLVDHDGHREVTSVIRSIASGKIESLQNRRFGWEVTYARAFEQILANPHYYYVKSRAGERVFLTAEQFLTTRNDDQNDPLLEMQPNLRP
jgi:FAD binding domain